MSLLKSGNGTPESVFVFPPSPSAGRQPTPTPSATAAEPHHRPSAAAAPLRLSLPPLRLPPAPDHPPSPTTPTTSSSSSLFSLAPSPASASTAYQHVPSWIACEIGRHELAPVPPLHGPAAALAGVTGAAPFSGNTGAGSGRGATSGADFDMSGSPPQTRSLFDTASLRRPPFHRSAGSYGPHATPRSHVKRPSSFHTSPPHSSGPDAAGPPSLATMVDRLRSEHEAGMRQFPPGGVLYKDADADADTDADAVRSHPSPSADGPATSFLSPRPPQSCSFLLHNSDLIELLNQDDRPTFIVDATSTENRGPGPLHVSFANAALQATPCTLATISGTSHGLHAEAAGQDAFFASFKAWVLGPGGNQEKGRAPETALKRSSSAAASLPSNHSFSGWQWAASTLRGHFRVIRAVAVDRPAGTAITSATPGATPGTPPRPDADASADGPRNGVGACPSAGTSGPGLPATIGIGDVGRPLPGVVAPASGRLPAAAGAAPSFDWTHTALSADTPAHIRFARSIDWASTPLGPIERWSGDLRIMTNLVMGSPHPVALYWGPEHTAIYNDAYTSLAGQKHPEMMGANYHVSWPEVWGAMKPIFDRAWHLGEAVLKQDNRLFIQRHGFLEEAFFNWSIVPLVGSSGSVVALYNPAFDNTRRVVNERRMLTLNEVGEKTATAQTISAFWQAVLCGLEYNEYDVPFVLLYSVAPRSNETNGTNGTYEADETDKDTADGGAAPAASSHGSHLPRVVLEGSLGVPRGHPAAVPAMDLCSSEQGFAPYMRQAMVASTSGPSLSSPSPVVLSAEDGTLPADLLAGLQGDRGFDDPCRTVVVVPVHQPRVSPVDTDASANLSVAGFLVMGTNPRRPYNGDYRLFVHLLARQLTTSLASVMLYEEEVRRSLRAARRAAQDRQELSQQLRLRTQQAVDSETKFMRMAEFTPVGMFVTDGTGRITYCNDMWWEISRHPRRDSAAPQPAPAPTSSLLTPVPVPASYTRDVSSSWSTWMDSVREEDQPALAAVWRRLVEDKVVVTHEFRFKQKTTIETEGNEPMETTTWVLLRAYPEKDESGNLKGIFGCITDISQQKLAEEFQIQLRKEAVEHKRQQENFIDITSHEMRNPLSAILQTVDEINTTIAELRAKAASGAPVDYDAVLDGILEASSTISLCTNHQKRIVDDVLTLSKLDSRLLPVIPVDVQPVTVIRGTLKMFEAELAAHDVSCTLRVQPSFQDLIGVDSWVKLDPSRLNQILINLLSNAIKFTQFSQTRSVSISIGASESGSDPADNDVADTLAEALSYLPSRQETPELADGPDWGTGPLVNLHIAVSDTGQGLHDDEKISLFQHFSQTSPRTHVEYGGPGLGLYISRILAELQGGQIGVASRRGHGSTFAFYIKCRKALAAPTALPPGLSSPPSAVFAHWPASKHTCPATAAFVPLRLGHGKEPHQARTEAITIPPFLPQLSSPPILEENPLSPGEGANDLRFPLPGFAAAAAAAGDRTWGAAETGCQDTALEPVASPTPALDVLIVEDNIVNQRVLQRQLTKCGNRTVVANHGGEALDILRRSSFWKAADEPLGAAGTTAGAGLFSVASTTEASRCPEVDTALPGTHISVVLMDLEMPVMDGMTCARAIRALERSGTLLRHVPIIAVTAYARLEQIESAKAAGIDDVISKPFRLAQLMPKIRELVAKYETV